MRRVEVVVLLAIAACGGEPVSPEEQARQQCQAAYDKLCDRACACTAGDGCDLTDDVGLVFTNDNRDECVRLGDVFCPDAETRPQDVDACLSDIDSAACQTQDDGEQALVRPPSCRE